MIRRCLNILFVFFCASNAPLSSHTFFREQPGTLLTCGVDFHRTRAFWNKSGSRQDNVRIYNQNTFWLYVEHDVTDRDAFFVFTKLRDVEDEQGGAATGLDEFEAAYKRTLFRKPDCPHVVAVQIVGVIPAGGLEHPGYRYGRWGGECDVTYTVNYDIASIPWQSYLLIGGRWYIGHPADQLRAEWRQSFDLCAWLQLQTLAELHYGLNNGSNRTIRGYPLISQYRLFTASGLARVRLNRDLSLVLRYYNHVWAENFFGGGGWSAGFWSEF